MGQCSQPAAPQPDLVVDVQAPAAQAHGGHVGDDGTPVDKPAAAAAQPAGHGPQADLDQDPAPAVGHGPIAEPAAAVPPPDAAIAPLQPAPVQQAPLQQGYGLGHGGPPPEIWQQITVDAFKQMRIPPSSFAHITGFTDRAACVPQACDQALEKLQDYFVLTWGGDYHNENSFTALIPRFLAKGGNRKVMAFRLKGVDHGHQEFKASWNPYAEMYRGAFLIVELDPAVDFANCGATKDTGPGGQAADLGRGTPYFLQGRSGVKVPGTTRVIALGGGGIVGREMLCSLKDGVHWTVFALSRGHKENQNSAMDVAAQNSEVELVRGIDPNEGSAFCRGLPAGASEPSWLALVGRPAPEQQSEPPLAVPQSGASSSRTFATSEFKRLYDAEAPIKFQDALFGALRAMLECYATMVGETQANAHKLFEVLQRQAFDTPDWSTLMSGEEKKVAKFAVVLWTSARNDGLRRQFCSILNHILRDDSGDALKHAVAVSRAMTCQLVKKRGQGDLRTWPPNNVSYRGSNIPRNELAFFQLGKSYRAPFFLATSFDEAKAIEFLRKIPVDDQVPVIFKFFLNATKKCDHAMYIEHITVVREEHELLYAPYSAFKVLNINIPQGDITWDNAAVIEIEVFPNNLSQPNDLPLSYWH